MAAAPKEITDLIDRSGNTFHARIARWFKDSDWHVVVSPFYMDQTKIKAREIDLIAEKLSPVSDHRGQPSGHIAIRLFIECKYLSSYSVIWLAEKDLHKAKKLVGRVLRLNYTAGSTHHYLCENSVAKLFASKGTGEHDPLYKAVNQVLNGMVSLRGRPVTHPDVDNQGSCRKRLEYPVVVCSSFDKMFSVGFYEETQAKPVEENFQLEVEYAYTASNGIACADYFLLDFVSEHRLGEFQQAVDADVKAAADVLRHQHQSSGN